MLKGFDSIGGVQIYWKFCEKTYLGPEKRVIYKDLIGPLADLYSYIIEYQARAICHLSKAQLSRGWENVAGGVDWDAMTSKIENSSNACKCHLTPLELREIRDHRDSVLQEIQASRKGIDMISDTLKETRRNYEDQKERSLFKTLASNYEDGKNYNPLRIPGTCEWFFQGDVLRNWRNSDRSSLLWISADPGCGKSVLSRALIDENRLSTNITTSTICYFFFKDGDERRMSATDALCALLHQIFAHDPTGTLIQNAINEHRKYDENLAQNFSELWRLFIKCVSSPVVGEIFCVLDALDECSVNSRDLIDKLKEFYSHPSSSTSKLKILITSRPYDNIEELFRKFPDTKAYWRLDGDEKSAEISEDINRVIDAKLEELTHSFLETDRQKISNRLKAMENRTYLWLHLTFDIIENSPCEYGRLSDIKTLLSTLPPETSKVYEKIMDRSTNEPWSETLLQIVLAASRPLSLDEAIRAFAIALAGYSVSSYASLEFWTVEQFKPLVKKLCGLINVYDSKLSFIHQTAREFFIKPRQSGKWEGRLSMLQSHKNMALICLSSLSHLDGQGSAKEIRAKFPLAHYSARHWMDHARLAETEEEVLNSVLKFLLEQSQSYADWGKLFDPDQPWKDEPHQDQYYKMATPLYYASLFGLQETAKSLLGKGADVNAEGGRYGNALQAASASGHKDIVALLLKEGADINAQSKGYGNALQAASSRNHKEIMQLLLIKGADVNMQGGRYGNALQAASAGGHKDSVALLLKEGADINAQSKGYGNALQAASAGGHQDVVQMLLDKKANVNVPGGGRYGNALQAASFSGYEGIVQLLLRNGADVNIEGGAYGNALQAASFSGHEEIVQLLLDNDADIKAQGGHYGNALQAASIGGHEGIVQLLLDNGADIKAQGGHYRNALRAASAGGHEGIVRLLLKKGVYYGNALQAASAGGHEGIVRLLLKKGVYYGNVLQAAAAGGHEGTVRLLLAESADMKIQNNDYRKALHEALERRHEGILQLLLTKSADIKGQSNYYRNVLHSGSPRDKAQLLLNMDSDVPGSHEEAI
jgi:ankyrin repeat protein